MVSTPLRVIWDAIAGVPDPEIPAVGIGDLGILRSVEWDRDDPELLYVTVTPTYAGCPATEVIAGSIRDALQALGVTKLSLQTRLAPAWTTDWISVDGARKLREFGIAPPHACVSSESRPASFLAPIDVAGISSLRRAAVACPRCGSADTRLLSQFGSTACKALYRCLACLEPFDYFKPH